MAWEEEEKENRALNPLRAFSHFPCYFLRCIFLVCLSWKRATCRTLLQRLLFASPAPLALSCSASSWGRMHFARCQRFFLLLPPIRFLFPLLQEYTLCASLHTSSSSSVYVLCFRFCFCFCFFSLSVSDKPLRVFPSRSTSADGGFVVLARLITEFRSICLSKFWSTPLKILLITPERLFKSWVRIPRERKAVKKV